MGHRPCPRRGPHWAPEPTPAAAPPPGTPVVEAQTHAAPPVNGTAGHADPGGPPVLAAAEPAPPAAAPQPAAPQPAAPQGPRRRRRPPGPRRATPRPRRATRPQATRPRRRRAPRCVPPPSTRTSTTTTSPWSTSPGAGGRSSPPWRWWCSGCWAWGATPSGTATRPTRTGKSPSSSSRPRTRISHDSYASFRAAAKTCDKILDLQPDQFAAHAYLAYINTLRWGEYGEGETYKRRARQEPGGGQGPRAGSTATSSPPRPTTPSSAATRPRPSTSCRRSSSARTWPRACSPARWG